METPAASCCYLPRQVISSGYCPAEATRALDRRGEPHLTAAGSSADGRGRASGRVDDDDVAPVQLTAAAELRLAVDAHHAVVDELARLRAGLGEAGELEELPEPDDSSEISTGSMPPFSPKDGCLIP